MNKKHLFWYAIFHPLVVLFLKIRFNYKFEKAKNLPENYIVISNHATDYDPVLVGASFKRQMYFVGSEHIARWKLAYKFLKTCFAPIMRPKGAPATSTIMEMIKLVKSGASVCLFAEGVRTWDGRTCPILPSTAKLIKSLGCGLVTYKLTGGYFVSPMWGGASVRKGSLHGGPVHVFTKEQLKAMSTDELYQILIADLSEDAYERQLANPQKYKGKNPAEHLENLLFICPKCGGYDSFTSAVDTVSCKNCDLIFKYNEYGMLVDAPYETVRDFSDWQKERLATDVANGIAYTAPTARLSTIKNHVDTPVTEGPVSLDASVLKCNGMEFPLDSISEFAMHGQHALVFTADKTYYELILPSDTNAYKFHLYFDTVKNTQK